ncbi:GntR family transcriptional regulator [Streptomyces sp. NPDC056656]|uniref:GntR family transcriptional regulator n=1 Tax=Streptomyces sp. NPDC056656 TaxID=3345895 RepID=UPI0036A52C7D
MAHGSDASSARMVVDLALAIQQGKVPPGQKLPTQAQLVQTYGVALPTVGAALRATGRARRWTIPCDGFGMAGSGQEASVPAARCGRAVGRRGW